MSTLINDLENIVNEAQQMRLNLQLMYTKYIENVLISLKDKRLETGLKISSNQKELFINSIYMDECLNILFIDTDENIRSWNDLDLETMDFVVNNIHIALLTEINYSRLQK